MPYSAHDITLNGGSLEGTMLAVGGLGLGLRVFMVFYFVSIFGSLFSPSVNLPISNE